MTFIVNFFRVKKIPKPLLKLGNQLCTNLCYYCLGWRNYFSISDKFLEN